MRHGRFRLAFCLSLALVVLAGFWTLQAPLSLGLRARAQDEKEKLDEEDLKDRALAERFRRVLETNPRRGTALDRIYGYHVERGTLDQLVGEYTARTKKDANDGVAWMIIGLLESQRGRDAAAVAAFKQAEAKLPQNAIPAWYLGQSLVLIGQPDAAAEAFERAITRKPVRNDLLDIFQALGRVYQRSQRTEKALDVWNRLEKLFPDDPRVQEQIAATLVEEGQFEQALPRLNKLADASEDKYRQSALRMDVADLKVKLKKSSEALTDFEKLIGELNPDSWLYRDVRRRIEEVFLRNDDLAGLAAYYQKWLEKKPTDVDAIARLAKALSSQGRAREARDWLSKGAALAPKNRALRQALIDQFVFEQDFAAAIKEYEQMDKADPDNPDTLREWGKLIMRDAAKPEADRRAQATAVWKRLVDKKPKDAVVASQTADLLRTANAVDEALALYKKAVELAPNAAQYREYLGEYYHNLKRSDEALAAWRPIAEGPNRTAKNLARLAEVFAGFGYRKEAVAAMADAISLEKDDFAMLMTYAELLHQDNRNDEALQQIAIAGKLASNPEDAEQVLVAQIKVYQATEKLGDRIDELQKELDTGKDATADRWLRLARFYEANRQIDKATETVAKAQEKDPKSIPLLIAAARIQEAGGNLLAAADINRKLAALDRRYRSEYLTAVAKAEQRLGRRTEALQAGRDLLAASPGNPEVYKFFADLCFQLGDQEEGLEALRRSVRANPSDPQGLITLANALSERVRQGEAIELLWRAFEKTNELDARLGVIERITQLYLENNQFDRLLERLERERREAEKAREITLCIAQAYTTAGDLGTARQQLERLLTENTRDTHLLGQLSLLCEQEGDLAASVKYQRQLNAAAPTNYDHQLRLAQLLTRSGEPEEAADIWVKLVSKETEQHRNLSAIDQLLTANKQDAALAILTRMLLQKPGNWELLYREGAALASKDKHDEAATRFRALLALKLPEDELGAITKHQIEQAKKKPAKSAQPQANNPYLLQRYDEWSSPPLTRRTGNVYRIRRATGMDMDSYSSPQPFYGPGDFGEARMACLAWLYEGARAKDKAEVFLKEPRDAKDKAGADPRPLWDWYYLQLVRNETKQSIPTALALSKGPDPAGLLAYLNGLNSRASASANRGRRSDTAKDSTPPLPADQLAHAMTCYRKLKQVKPDWVTSAVTKAVLTELKRAGKEGEEKTVYQDLLKEANTVARVQAALAVATERNDLETTVDLLAKLERLQPPVKTTATLNQLPTRQAYSTLTQLMYKRADDKKLADVRTVADTYLALARRQNLTAVKSASSTRRPSTGGFSTNIPRGQSYTRIQVNYPSPNSYYDEGPLSVLYVAFDLHKKADLLSDYVAHLRTLLDAARGAEKLYLQLALGYVQWWSNDKDEALSSLTDAVQSAANDHNLLLEVSSLRELNNDFDAALTLLDSFTPLDTQMMQRREEAALRLAERTGNLERARQAADRLFGLRLDADKQLELAGKMHRLGMAEAAETVLGRAQRQAGNKTATLVRLMNQYQGQNQIDLAVQIARQILRKGPSNFNPRGGDETDGARSQAISVLARSGQLKDMIERAEAQLKASPKSIQIHQTLAGYYQAANDKKKLKEIVLKTAELKPQDGKLRWQAAQQLQQAGDRDAAIAQYKIGIKLEPSLFSNRYWEVQQLFASANKLDELAQVFDEIDLRKIGSYWTVMEPVSALLEQDNTKDLGLKLFKKAWEAFPQYRGYLLGQLYREEIWRVPEIYTFAKQGVIPREDSELDPWQSTSESMSYGQEGRVEGVVTRLLSMARKQQRLPELRDEVATAIKTRPEWLAGKALLAILEIQSGNKAHGRQLWQEVFNDRTDVPPVARFILTQELEFYAGVEDLAIQTLEAGIEDMMRDGDYEFSYTPARRLVWWYEQLGRKDDARKLISRLARTDKTDPGYYPSGYMQYRIVRSAVNAGQELVRMGEPVEAVRLYNQLLTDTDTLNQANQYSGGEQFDRQLEQGLQAAIKALKPSALPTALGDLMTPREARTADKPALDLVLIVESRDLSRTTINSLFATAIKSTDKAPEARKTAFQKLADLVKQHPNDFSVQTAAVLAAFADGNQESSREAVERLVKLTDATPLETLPPNGKPNARQRAQAQLQIPVWLAARECLAKGRESSWPAGEKLAARAAAAARRQHDLYLAMAVLREWGQLEVERGDTAKAQACFAEMLELTLPKPTTPKAAPAPKTPVVPGVPVPAVPAVPPMPKNSPAAAAINAIGAGVLVAQVAAPPLAISRAAPAPNTVGAPTEEQFQRAFELASLAVEKGLTDLSMQAMSKAVRSGPPIAPQNTRGGGGPLRMRMINGVQYYVSGGNEHRVGVGKALVTLAPLWREKGVPVADVYNLLAQAVLPEGRPAEVFLHTETQTFNTIYSISPGGYLTQATGVVDDSFEDRGLGELLIQIAIEAGKADDLRTRIEARAKQPLGELSARLLLSRLAVQSKDEPRAKAVFQAMGERIKKDSLMSTNLAISAALTPALSDPRFAAMVAPYIEKVAENFTTGGGQGQAVDLRFKLADYHLARKDEAAARAQYKIVEGLSLKGGPNQQQTRLSLAQQYLKAGWVEDALRELGLHVDESTADNADPQKRPWRTEPTLAATGSFVRLTLLLLQMPAARRYEVLKQWSLPTAGRKSIRYYVEFTPRHVPPTVQGFPVDRVINTLQLLADAAKECGKLDELTTEAERLAKENIENAELLQVLTSLTRGKGSVNEAVVKTFADAARKRMDEKRDRPRMGRRYYGEDETQQPVPVRPTEFLVATLALNEPRLATIGEDLLTRIHQQAEKTGNSEYMARIRSVQDRHAANRAGVPQALANALPAHWQNATAGSSWFAQDGYLTQASSEHGSLLLFDRPLAGTFEFSVDVWQGAHTEGHVGYGGLEFEAVVQGRNGSQVAPVGRHEQIYRQADDLRAQAFNRVIVQVSPGRIRCLVNDKLFYEDDEALPTSPWLMLCAGAQRRPVYRNFKLSGKPEVLAEVPLLAGSSLEGWRTNVYGGTLPQRLVARELARGEAFDQWGNPRYGDPQQKTTVFDWQAKDGELVGRRFNRAVDRPVPSSLVYFRPLQPNETVRYEFYHEAGKMHVSPCLGRQAFLLEPDGVKLHYLVDRGEDQTTEHWSGLTLDNIKDDAAGRRGDKLPLKEKDWNTVVLTTTADGVKIELNGTLVYESRLTADIERTFGFFHYRERTGARIRKVVLSGAWPKTLPSLDEGTFSTESANPVEARVRRSRLGERYYATEVGELLARVKTLPAAERYKILTDQVLPTAKRPVFQLAGTIKPQEGQDKEPKKDVAARRVLLGGTLEAPCLELIAAAREAGTLDDLRDRVLKAGTPGEAELFQRAKTAYLAAVLAASGKDDEASKALQGLMPFMDKLKLDTPGQERWPELIAALGTLDRPALVKQAGALAVTANKQLEQAVKQEMHFEDQEWWTRAFRAARTRAELLGAAGTRPTFAHWSPVTGLTATSRAQGWDAPRWSLRDGTLVHHPGFDQDYLVLHTPLRGDFEVTCDLFLEDWQEAHVRYGSRQFELERDRKKYRLLSAVHQAGRPVTIIPPLPETKGNTYKFRMVVKDGWYRAYVDGRELTSSRVGVNPEPWLMLHCHALNLGKVSNLKILGTPTVPTTIDLLTDDDLGMWRPYFGNAWTKRGEEMYEAGKKPDPPEEGKPVPPHGFPEAANFYQRPFLEDGVVEYEFYYEPDKAMVHPALDRLTFLLEPEGVKLHWLTDGPSDQRKLAIDNATDEPACRRGPEKLPLNAKAWNKVRLSVAGDTVKVALNGVDVYERTIEPTNQRFFGLFHYTDRTEARVRGMTYTGAWPRERVANERLFELKK